MDMIFWVLLAFIAFILITTIMSGRKEKRRVAEMLSSLSKGDKVQTAGGMIGTIAEVRDDTVVLRVDESTNTRIRFARSAVQKVLKPARDRDARNGAAEQASEEEEKAAAATG